MIDPKTGKIVRTVMKDFELSEISAVDRPAQSEAKAQLMKVLETAVTTQSDGHAHIIVGLQAGTEGLAEIRSGMTSYNDGHVHAWAMDEAGNILIADAEGHTHQIAALMQKDLQPEALVTQTGEEETASNETAEALGDSGEDGMSDQITHEELLKRLEKAERYGQLTDAEKAFMKSLDGEAAQAEFLQMSDEQRADRMESAKEADPVVYKSQDGDIFRKSDDVRLVKAAQMLDEERMRRMKMEQKAKKAELEKRAQELPLAGELEARVLVLKAIDSLPEDERVKAEQVLKANADRLSKALETIGTTDGSVEEDPVDAIAKRLRDSDPKLTYEQAYAKALRTPEGEAAVLAKRG
jgi:hypothetical protein